ncbi:MAG: hypothetical protein RLZZ74_3424 [Cyanobacteriota bacterium]|jgi:hypothetical protein
MATTNIIGNFQAAGNAPGVVPLGAIIAMTSGLTGAMAIPASGVVSNGYMRADGTAIPASNSVSGTSPNLSGSIYLRGSTTYGGTGGSNTSTIAAANLPPHVHTIDHDHGNVTSTGMSANTTHGHGITDPGHIHVCPAYGVGGNAANVASALNSFFNTNVTSSATTGISVNTSANLDHSHNVDLPNFTGNSGNGPGTTTAFSTEPNYINVVYLIRVN